MAKKKSTPKLIVVFDTSVIHTPVASDLIRPDAQRIIADNSKHQDLDIDWYVPDVVIGERRYQMLVKAKELLPNMQKMEKLLGAQFGVGEHSLSLHVDNAINKAVDEFGLQVASVNASDVDWPDLVDRSVSRKPPFMPNEKEKGFRDSVIAHSFLQIVVNSPVTPSICRLALVSGDQGLKEYVIELTGGAKNVRILSSLEELEGLINTLVSTITEEFAAELASKASKIFFQKDDDKTFYYKEEIRAKIQEQHASELSEVVFQGHNRENGSWWISRPIFIKKENQLIHWSSTIEIDFEIFHYEQDEATQNRLATLNNLLKDQQPPVEGGLLSGLRLGTKSAATRTEAKSISEGIINRYLSQNRKKIVDLKAKDKFEVYWSTRLTPTHKLTTPKLEKLLYLGSNAGEQGP